MATCIDASGAIWTHTWLKTVHTTFFVKGIHGPVSGRQPVYSNRRGAINESSCQGTTPPIRTDAKAMGPPDGVGLACVWEALPKSR
jgi:hypothetical protein